MARKNTYRRAPTNQKALALSSRRRRHQLVRRQYPYSVGAARDMAWRGYDCNSRSHAELPKNTAAQCNPQNPQMAFDVLKAEWT